MRTNARPTRPGMVDQSTARANTRRRDGVAYPVNGSAALAPSYETEAETDVVDGTDIAEPVRTRTAAQRKAADEAAARRAAARDAKAATMASRRRLRVAPPLPVSVARAPFVASLIGIVVLGVIGILVLNTMINANQFRLNNLQTQQAGLDKQEQGLKEKLAHQEAPGSLVAAAKCLGLVPAGSLAYIKMPNGAFVGVPAPATRTASVTHQPAEDDPSIAACIDSAMDGN